MKKCNINQLTPVGSDGQGPSLSLVSSQAPGDPGGWKIFVFARFPDRDCTRVLVGSISLSAVAPGVKQTARLLAIATMPGATGYSADVLPPQKPATLAKQPLQVGLFCGPMTAFPLTGVNS